MKLMLVGSDKVFAIENMYATHLAQAGVSVNLFTAQSRFFDYYQAGILNKLLFKTGLSGIIRRINKELLEEADRFRPDVLWVFKGMEVSPDTLRTLHGMGVGLVNYNPDNPFLFTGKGSGNAYVTKSIGLYDLHFTYNLSIQHQLQTEYGARTAFLPFGFEVSDELLGRCEAEPEVVRACFLGNPDKQRAAFLQSVAAQGMEMDVYGHGWDRFLSGPAFHIKPPVYGDELWKVLRRYRVQLNIMRVHNPDSHNMRTFEVPGIGGIELAPDTPEHRSFFEEGKEIFLFHDAVECAAKMRHILSMSEEQARMIRVNARERSLRSGYRYADRAAFALKTMKEVFPAAAS